MKAIALQNQVILGGEIVAMILKKSANGNGLIEIYKLNIGRALIMSEISKEKQTM